MTMRLTKAGTMPQARRFAELEIGEFFKRVKNDESPMYERIVARGSSGLNAVEQPSGTTVCVGREDLVYRVTVKATWEWPQ